MCMVRIKIKRFSILQGCHFTWKYPEIDNLGQKNLEFLTIFTSLVVKFCFDTKKNCPRDNFFSNSSRNFFLKNHI